MTPYYISPALTDVDGWIYRVVCAHTRRVRLVCTTLLSALELCRGS